MSTSPSATKKEDDRSDSGNNTAEQSVDEVALTPIKTPIKKSSSLSALDDVNNSPVPWETPIESVEILDRSSDMPFKTPTGDIADKNTPWKTPSEYPGKDIDIAGERSGTVPFKTPTKDVPNNGTPWKTPQEQAETENLAFQPKGGDDIMHSPARNTTTVIEATSLVSNIRRSSIRKSGLRRRSESNGDSKIDRNTEKSVSFGTNLQSVQHEIVFEKASDDNDDAYGQFSGEESPKLEPQQLLKSMTSDQAGQENQEDLDQLSLPDLKLSSKRISFTNRPGHNRFNSNVSEISLDSVGDDIFQDAISDFHSDNRAKMVQMGSRRRLSLAVDIETGRSATPSSKTTYYRGQQAIRRVHSNEMLNAQSPRSRRRRTMSYNMEQFRKNMGEKIVSLASPMNPMNILVKDERKVDVQSQEGSKNDDDLSFSDQSRESLRMADMKRRKRYDVEQVQVMNSERSRSSSIPSQVQYRLSAITPIELRRRRYRSSLRGLSDEHSAVDASGKSESTKFSNGTGGCVSPDNRCNRFIQSLGNFIIEVVIFIISKGKENYSVGVINRVLFWSFRKNLLIVLLSAACSFYVMTMIFAILIFLVGLNNPQCIRVVDVDFGDTRNRFVDAFALSWTTFTTVGYGLVFPGTSATIDNATFSTCAGMGIITTFEAFIGILFSGFWGAIWFAKVTRVSSFAQVSFSEWIVIKYGTGVMGTVKNEGEYEEGSSEEEVIMTPSERSRYKQSKLPPPIFEFRVVNRLNRQKGGEIIDACLNIVASMEESQATRTVQNGAGMAPSIRRKGRRPKRNSAKKLESPSGRKLRDDEEGEKKIVDINQLQDAARAMVESFTDSENNRESSKSKSSVITSKIPNQIFAKLHVESSEHPFFKRVWNIRHVLDVSSPLLKPEAKDLMRANGGHWPEELNNAMAVRASIQFDQILVSFSGTSNVDANSVYSQNAYKFEDVCVGYAFCNMLYREPNGNIGVDQTLLNDVKEQSGGGGEDLHRHEVEDSSTRSVRDIFIL